MIVYEKVSFLAVMFLGLYGCAYIPSVQVAIHNVQQIDVFRSKFLETVKIEAAKYETKVTSA